MQSMLLIQVTAKAASLKKRHDSTCILVDNVLMAAACTNIVPNTYCNNNCVHLLTQAVAHTYSSRLLPLQLVRCV